MTQARDSGREQQAGRRGNGDERSTLWWDGQGGKGIADGDETVGHGIEAGGRMGDEKWRMERSRTLLPADGPGSGWVKRRSSTLASPPLDGRG